MNGLGGMEEVARRAGRRQGGADLLSDDSRFTDAADDAGAAAVMNHLARSCKRGVDDRRDGCNRLRFRLYHLPCICQIKFHL